MTNNQVAVKSTGDFLTNPQLLSAKIVKQYLDPSGKASDRLCSSRRTPVTKSFTCFGGDFSRGLLSISCHKQFSFLNYLTCYFHKELERSYQNVLVKIYYSLNAFICQYVVQERGNYIVETQYIVF